MSLRKLALLALQAPGAMIAQSIDGVGNQSVTKASIGCAHSSGSGTACRIDLLNNTGGTITTGAGGNFNAAYAFAVGIPASCWYYVTNSKWYCHV